MWAAPTQGAEIQLQWGTAVYYTRPTEKNSSTISTAVPGHFKTSPPAGLFKGWLSPNSNSIDPIIFYIYSNTVTALCDITVSYQIYQEANASPETIATTAAGTAGTLKYPYLDGTIANWVPLGLPTIV